MDRRYRDDMESDLYDLRNMSIIVETLIEDAWRCKEEKALDNSVRLLLTNDQWQAINFAVIHAGDMSRKRLTNYLDDLKKARVDAPA